jgi:HAD superfamily hydrolase (TIGR01549 family)
MKAVIFDLYDTLIYFNVKMQSYRKLFIDLNVDGKLELEKAKNIALTEDFINLDALVNRLRPEASINIQIYENMIENEVKSVKLYQETLSVLKRLKDRGLKLGLISNSAFSYKTPFYDLGLDLYFDTTLFSFEVGMKKPNLEIYKLILQKLDVLPDQCIMIGDKIIEDVEAPQQIGIRSLLCDRKLNSENSIENLNDIFKYI